MLCECKSQSRQDDDSALLTWIQGTKADGADCGSKLKDAASSSVRSHSEATASPEDESKRGAALSLRQQILVYLMQTCISKSKRSSKKSSNRDKHPDCQVEQTKDTGGQATFQPDTVNIAATTGSDSAALAQHQCCLMIKAVTDTSVVAPSAARYECSSPCLSCFLCSTDGAFADTLNLNSRISCCGHFAMHAERCQQCEVLADFLLKPLKSRTSLGFLQDWNKRGCL